MKRYSIVEVGKDGNCLEEFICSGNCNKCDYGDTKEQLEKKVAQVIFKNAPQETYHPKYIEQREKILKVAKEIVEFLGVKE